MLSKIKSAVAVAGLAAGLLGLAAAPASAGTQGEVWIGTWDTQSVCLQNAKAYYNQNPGYTGYFCRKDPIDGRWDGFVTN
ncbi:hypothetical protein JOF53_005089 [Crossiella equi]|uniref:Uncharacterized protein n=1 Tax=Crossiella equi TaxID=130796 RepID=A0ABS5AIK7_9PSEU|nr:hypothetical protein [Crossiella equi]MBP2476217.1 hypothetical protein [Crossiella equi]